MQERAVLSLLWRRISFCDYQKPQNTSQFSLTLL
ncbi:rCG56150 [Rattus norvegicus]|uniref:RCG56150 n=1 Tax=Rattus norvegicus TaxID=10116 RepID=A6IA71_RAT|nr:rCG56150 [Rattus norvegicus]